MKPIDYILLGIIALIVAGAIALNVRRKKKGTCCSGSCENCKRRSSNCH